ncbi:MAG: MlaE family ABC transporter permease [Cytophagaceae bacterium]
MSIFSSDSEKPVSRVKNFFAEVGDMTSFTGRYIVKSFKRPFEFLEVLTQMYVLGVRSLFLVSISSFIIGLVITIQLTPVFRQFGAEMMIPNMVTVAIIREIGPVLTGIVCAGKIGSAIGAEIGSMKVSEQIDAMAISGVDPFKYLVFTRVTACTLVLPILVIYSAAWALLGCFLAVNLGKGMGYQLFLTVAFNEVMFYDFVPSLIKSFFFGYTIGLIGCYYGYKASKGTRGVGKAAHSSVVISTLIIFFIDMIAAQLNHMFFG